MRATVSNYETFSFFCTDSDQLSNFYACADPRFPPDYQVVLHFNDSKANSSHREIHSHNFMNKLVPAKIVINDYDTGHHVKSKYFKLTLNPNE